MNTKIDNTSIEMSGTVVNEHTRDAVVAIAQAVEANARALEAAARALAPSTGPTYGIYIEAPK